MKPLSHKHQTIEASKTLAINAKANELKAQGIKIINFSSGEPDFSTPKHIRDKAIDFIHTGQIRYTAAAGMKELKEIIVKKLKKDNQLEYTPDQIIVSSGAKHSLYNALQVLLNEKDEVIIASPYWTSYPEMVKLAGGTPVFVDTESHHFALKAEEIKRAITPNTKAIILNSPNNPTGVVYTKEDLQAIGDVATKHNLYIISDEIYEKLIYQGKHVSIAALSKDLYQRTIVINGLSKAYAMTGWRIGYAAADQKIVKIMSNLQSHATSNANTITQHAALAALGENQAPVETMRQAFDERRKVMMKRIRAMSGFSLIEPKGAFYIMLDVSKLYGKTYKNKTMHDTSDVAACFLEEAHVAVVPGIAFGTTQYVRVTYATGLDDINEGLNRIETIANTIFK